MRSNLYLHGTNSKALAFLSKTDNQLLSSKDVLKNYLLAPLTGELVNPANAFRCTDHSNTMCFALLSTPPKPNLSTYSLEKIINYTDSKRSNTEEESEALLKRLFQSLKKNHFATLEIFLIHAARYRQAGNNLRSLKELNTFFSNIQETIDLFYLYLIIFRYFESNLQSLSSQSQVESDLKSPLFHYEEAIDAFESYFTNERITQLIKQKKINLRAIYEYPIEHNLKKILDLFELPKQLSIKDNYWAGLRTVTLKKTQLFKRRVNSRPNLARCLLPNLISGGYSSSAVLSAYLRHEADISHETDISEVTALQSTLLPHIDNLRDQATLLLSHIDSLRDQATLFARMLEKSFKLEFTPEEQSLIDEPFPLIFICDNKDHMVLVDAETGEYHSKCPLKLDKDISLVATDNVVHQQRLEAYFLKKQLKIKVILFDELYMHRYLLIAEESIEQETEALSLAQAELKRLTDKLTNDSKQKQEWMIQIDQLSAHTMQLSNSQKTFNKRLTQFAIAVFVLMVFTGGAIQSLIPLGLGFPFLIAVAGLLYFTIRKSKKDIKENEAQKKLLLGYVGELNQINPLAERLVPRLEEQIEKIQQHIIEQEQIKANQKELPKQKQEATQVDLRKNSFFALRNSNAILKPLDCIRSSKMRPS